MLHQLIQFVIKHWILVAAFIVVMILIVIEEIRAQSAGGERLSATSAVQLMNREDAVVIDLRDANAFRDGHIVNAKNIALADFDRHIEKLNAYRNRPIILVDAMGLKTVSIAQRLKKEGFEKVMTLKGGIEAWKTDNMPLVKK